MTCKPIPKVLKAAVKNGPQYRRITLCFIQPGRYREKSHYCLIVAMKALFVAERLLDVTLVEAFGMAKILRENADYDNEYSKESARSLIEKAKKFFAAGL